MALGTDPTNADTDGDGVPDGLDQFPTDNRRSDYIRVRYYGVTDLSEEMANPAPAVFQDLFIALNDAGRIAWSYEFFDDPQALEVGGSTIRTIAWDDGKIIGDSSLPTSGGQFADVETARLRGVLPDGTAYGQTYRQHAVRDARPFVAKSGLVSFLGGPPVSSDGIFLNQCMSELRHYVGYARRVFRSDADPGWQVSFANPPMAVLGQAFSASSVSRSGVFAGSGDGYSHLLWSAPGGFRPLPGPPYGVNDRSQVVGELDPTNPASYDANGYPLGFYFEGTTHQVFQNLLPARFRQAIRSAIPYQISEVASPAVSPLIYFSAESLTDEGDTWAPQNFLWWRDETGVPQIARVRAEFQAEDVVIYADDLAADGSVATVKNVAGAERPLLATDISFRADDIRLGFDLPIEGDKEPPRTGDDTHQPEWWTKVARAPGSALTPNVNSNIRVVFKSAAAASNYRIVVPESSRALIDVSPSPTASLGQETLLTITGKDPVPLDQRRQARIQIKAKKGNADVRTLDVDLLPVRKIKIGVYFVKGWSASNSDIPEAFKIAGTIVDRLNEIFQQACVEFELGHTGDLISGFDLNGDDALDCGQFSVEKNTLLLPQNTTLPDRLNLLIVRNILDDFGSVGVTPTIENPDRSIVESLYFETAGSDGIELFLTTCAHEIGHALGLSTRNRSLSEGSSNFRHDSGAYPSAYYHLDGTRVNDPGSAMPRMDGALMKQRGGKWRWMRHQDWKKANDNAEHYVIP